MKLPGEFAERMQAIPSADGDAWERAHAHLDHLTKPRGSLGRLESIAAQYLSASGTSFAPLCFPLRKAVYVFAADHGIVSEGVSAYPQEVTTQMVRNFLDGGAAINVLARQHGAELLVIDAGVNSKLDAAPGLYRAKIAAGTANFAIGPAMSKEQLLTALSLGLTLADRAHRSNQQLIAVGEMGIGNTTSASAITAMLTGRPLVQVTGRGAGLDDTALDHKRRVLERALALHTPAGQRKVAPLDVLRAVGGLEIAAMTGFILGLAGHRRAIICDGFISTAAAAIAFALAPNVKDHLYAGHRSAEPGHRLLLDHIGLQPILELEMRLGEGTGAVLAMPIIESALRLYQEMATFAAAGVSEAQV